MKPEHLSLVPMTNSLVYQAEIENRSIKVASGRGGDLVRRCLMNGSIQGTFVDSEDAPEWARKLARYARDSFKANCRCLWKAEDAIASALQGQGRGKRAVHFQHAVNLDPRIFQGNQQYNNCCAWCYREIGGACIAVDKIEFGDLHSYTARPGTAGLYANRGSRADQGMAMSEGAEAIHNIGITLEMAYPNYDLSTQAKDERAGVDWGATGIPSDLLELVKNDRIEQISIVQEEEAVLDILYGGHFIATGSTRTAGGNGDPVSKIGRIGGHAQAMIGYDDTDEFRGWYEEKTGQKLNDWVGIFDQSWGEDWISVTNWPTHIWGPRPEGAFVLKGKDAMELVTIWGEAFALSKVMGFPMRELPDWGSGEYL